MPLEFPLFVNSSGRDISFIERKGRNVFVGNSVGFVLSIWGQACKIAILSLFLACSF
jgi:hypothetical protein